MTLTMTAALEAYARMINRLDASSLVDFLADDFHYASQWVFQEIESKQAFLDYICPKLEAIRSSVNQPRAEMAALPSLGDEPCVVLSQGAGKDLIATVLARFSEGKIQRLDMCEVPSPQSTIRSGSFPT
jgi:hypothetical protein